MKYAVIKIGTDQFLAEEGKTIKTKRIKGEEGSAIKLGETLILVDESKVLVGKPQLNDVEVWGKIEKQSRSKKLEVYKYRSKSRYRRKTGHRERETEIKIEKIKI